MASAVKKLGKRIAATALALVLACAFSGCGLKLKHPSEKMLVKVFSEEELRGLCYLEDACTLEMLIEAWGEPVKVIWPQTDQLDQMAAVWQKNGKYILVAFDKERKAIHFRVSVTWRFVVTDDWGDSVLVYIVNDPVLGEEGPIRMDKSWFNSFQQGKLVRGSLFTMECSSVIMQSNPAQIYEPYEITYLGKYK